jgi:hypothetical protein
VSQRDAVPSTPPSPFQTLPNSHYAHSIISTPATQYKQVQTHLPPVELDKALLSILFNLFAVFPFVLFLCPLTGNPIACCLPINVPTVLWCAMFPLVLRRRSSSITSVVMGSCPAGGGSLGDSAEREVAGVEEEAKEKGARGVEGRGAAAGAESRAERALICGSSRSITRSWSWNCRRAMMSDDVRWLMPWNASKAIWRGHHQRAVLRGETKEGLTLTSLRSGRVAPSKLTMVGG